MSDNPTFQIPADVIQPILNAHVSAALVQAFGDKSKILEAAVCRVLNQMVNSDGKPSSYHSREDMPWIQYVVSASLQESVKRAIVEGVAQHEMVIKKCIAAQLKDSKSPVVAALVEGLVGQLVNPDNLKYRLTVTAEERK